MPLVETSATAPAVSSILEVIEFEIAEKGPNGKPVSNFFGINVNKVREVIVAPAISHSAREHPALEGVIDLRGDVIPIINLPRWLGKWEPDYVYDRIIVAEFNMLRAGFMVSRVHRIHRIPFDQLTPPTAFMKQGKQLAATGLYRNAGRIVMMLDLERLLTDIDPDTMEDTGTIEPSPVPGRTVMVVDDSGLTRGIMEAAFKESGYEVMTASNGVDAIRDLEELQREAAMLNRPLSDFVNAVTIDVEMPMMDGIHLARILKGDKRFEGLKIIVYSSMATPDRIAHWKSLGVDDAASKPQVTQLIQKVNALSSL